MSFEAETGSLYYGSRPRPTEASHPGLLRRTLGGLHAETGNLHDRLLSVCEIKKASPGAPNRQNRVKIQHECAPSICQIRVSCRFVLQDGPPPPAKHVT